MAGVLDYLKWRGDLRFSASPFCDVDALVLSRISYVPFEGILDENPRGEGLPVPEAARRCLAGVEKGERTLHLDGDAGLLRALTDSPRFADVRLFGYVSRFDKAQEKQFSAVSAALSPGETFLAYRGTDGTVVGWKEDFNMSFEASVPAQLDALEYMREIAAARRGTLRGGGHSKGGNLAVYASAMCGDRIQRRIESVCNFDGPGFLDAVLAQDGFRRIRDRVRTYIPQSSVVGMLLEHDEQFSVVHSTNSGLLQHDVYSWELERDDFLYVEGVTESSQFLDATLKDWVASMTVETREKMIDGIFSVVTSLDAVTLRDLWKGKNPLQILKNLTSLDAETRELLTQALSLLKDSAVRALPDFILDVLPEALRPYAQALFENKNHAKEPVPAVGDESHDFGGI